MQKIVAFLEQNVQWVAVGVGGLFLLLMVFVYVIDTPISAKVGSKEVTLANVETVVFDDNGRRLEQAMAGGQVPDVKIEPYAQNFRALMAMKDVQTPEAIAGVWTPGGAPLTPLRDLTKPSEIKGAQAKVEGLPGPLPEPKFYEPYTTGRTNANTDPAARPAGSEGAMPGGMAGGYPGGLPGGYPGGMPGGYPGGMPGGYPGGMPGGYPGGMPGGYPGGTPGAYPAGMPSGYPGAQPGVSPTSTVRNLPGAVAPGGSASPAGPEGTDKIWVTQAFTISMDEVVNAFAKAKVPENLTTQFVRIDVIRQEMLPTGEWGNEKEIAPLAYNQVPAFPKEGASLDERSYIDWLSRNPSIILTPPFYTRIAGDLWYAPGQPDPNKASEVKSPLTPSTGYPGSYPGGPSMPGGRRTRQPGMGGSGMPGQPGQGGSRSRSRSYAPQDEQRSAPPFLQAAPRPGQTGRPGTPPGYPTGGYPTGGMPGMPGMSMPGMPGTEGAAGTGLVPEGYKAPAGSFNPNDLDADAFGWFHDDTVEPGKTYRYKVRYKIRNPLWGSANLASDPKMARVFSITSPYSEWSKPVAVDPISRFFVAVGIASGATNARFDVYRWQNGTWHMKQFAASPGDMIGGLDDKDKVDYTTGWTLADIDTGALSKEPVIVTDDRGNLESRSFSEDQSNVGVFKKEVGYKDPNAQPKLPAPGEFPGMMPPGGFPPGGYPGMMPPGAGGRPGTGR